MLQHKLRLMPHHRKQLDKIVINSSMVVLYIHVFYCSLWSPMSSRLLSPVFTLAADLVVIGISYHVIPPLPPMLCQTKRLQRE